MLPSFLDKKILLLTGKGGGGKSTAAAAAALLAHRYKERVLLVQITPSGRLPVFGHAPLPSVPRKVRPGISVVAVDPTTVLEEFLHGLLWFRFLSRRLLRSVSFQAVTAATPGLEEFLALTALVRWVPRYDLIVVDAPPTGHAVPLLRIPEALLSIAPFGSLAELSRQLHSLLCDPGKTTVMLVTTPEELAINETVELYTTLHQEPRFPLGPPIISGIYPERFTPEEEEEILSLVPASRHDASPLLRAARYQVVLRRRIAAQVDRLQHELGRPPILLPFFFVPRLTLSHLEKMADILGQATL